MLSYDTKDEFDDIVKFLTLSKNMKNRQCYKDVKGKETVHSIVSQLAITDTNTEGFFIDHYSEHKTGPRKKPPITIVSELLWKQRHWMESMGRGNRQKYGMATVVLRSVLYADYPNRLPK